MVSFKSTINPLRVTIDINILANILLPMCHTCQEKYASQKVRKYQTNYD